MASLEEENCLRLDFHKLARAALSCPDLVPVAVQNIDTTEVILVAYTNEAAFKESLATRRVVLWSTSRGEMWRKGETSGNTFELVEVYVNCEQNSLLYRVRPAQGNICHTNNRAGQPRNCFYRRVNLDTQELENTDP